MKQTLVVKAPHGGVRRLGLAGRMLVKAIIAGLFTTLGAITLVEQTPAEEFPDRFMIRGGYGLVFNADTTFNFNGASGVGGVVDYSLTLGGSRDDEIWRIDAFFHLTPRHSFNFSYYDVTRTGNRELTQDILIGDVTYAAGGTIDSELAVKLYRLFYDYSFYQSEKVDLAGSVGLYVAGVRAAFDGNLTCTGGPTCGPGTTLAAGASTEELTIPLPSLGFQLKYNILPRLQVQLRFDWFYLEVADVKGAMTEMYLGAEYRLFKHFAIGAAFDRLSIDVDYKPRDDSGFGVENTWNSVFMYGALYF
jgi:hypothetical protein